MTTDKGGSWLDKLAPRPLPPRELSPNLIFGFDDVMAVIAVGEAAMKTVQQETHAAHAAAAMKAAQDRFHSHAATPIFAPMAVAMWKTELTFPLILRRALFCGVCAHVEHSLKRWCALLHGDWSLPSPPPKKAGGGVSMAFLLMRYLDVTAGLAIGDFESWPEWTRFDTCRKARNCLEHEGGDIDDAPLAAALEALGCIEIDRSGLLDEPASIHLLPGACEAAALNGKALFERLVAACERHPRTVAAAAGDAAGDA